MGEELFSRKTGSCREEPCKEEMMALFQWKKNTMYDGAALPQWLSREATASVRAFHKTVPGYGATPLVSLPHLARRLGIHALYVKDESKRFGLNAFKGLGGVYAVARAAAEAAGISPEGLTWEALTSPAAREKISALTFVTATDGNHGRGVAWAAHLLGCRSVVYMPRGSAQVRAEAIRAAGASEVTITDLTYDDAVRKADAMGKERGWRLIQDTAWPGYEKPPRWIVEGYTTMVWEALDQMKAAGAAPTHVLLQAGVGALAGSVTGALAAEYGAHCPVIASVEPEEAACLYQSIAAGDGAPHKAEGSMTTIMAGLNCGEPCTLTWPILKSRLSAAIACGDAAAARGMRLYGAPRGGDAQIISGESGAAPLGALSLMGEDCRHFLGLGKDAAVLLFNTEGDTDRDNWESVVYDGAWPLA